MPLEVDRVAPPVRLRDQHLSDVALPVAGTPALVVFYPFSFSVVCTDEMRALDARLEELRSGGADVVAISCDAPATQRAFAERERLRFPVLSDFWPHGQAARAYDVFNDRIGAALRGSFVVDAQGVLRWQVVNDLPDARDVDDYVRALSAVAGG